jgi:hypothetical protein
MAPFNLSKIELSISVFMVVEHSELILVILQKRICEGFRLIVIVKVRRE